MISSIKEMFKYGKEIELVTPDEEARMDLHCRHGIAYIRDSLGLALVARDIEDVRESMVDAVSGTREVMAGPEYKINKAAFLERVIGLTPGVRDRALESGSYYERSNILEKIEQLNMMREQFAQPHEGFDLVRG